MTFILNVQILFSVTVYRYLFLDKDNYLYLDKNFKFFKIYLFFYLDKKNIIIFIFI